MEAENNNYFILEFRPQPDITMEELAAILAALGISVDGSFSERLGEKLLRHFVGREIEVSK